MLQVPQMNLHEECLLNYLRYPDELSHTTELLKLNNMILEQTFVLKNILSKNIKLNLSSVKN